MKTTVLMFAAAAIPFVNGLGEAHAGNPGFEAADAVCATLRFDSDKSECLAEVAKAEYMNEAAAKTCGTLRFDQDKVDCLKKIRDLEFTASAARVCGDMRFDQDKVDCLTKNGRKFVKEKAGKLALAQLGNLIDDIIKDIDNGRVDRARRKLVELSDAIE